MRREITNYNDAIRAVEEADDHLRKCLRLLSDVVESTKTEMNDLALSKYTQLRNDLSVFVNRT